MIIVDIETVPEALFLKDPPDWFKESKLYPRPKLGNLVDPKKVEAKIAEWEANGGAVKDLSVNPYTARPVIIGYKIDNALVNTFIPSLENIRFFPGLIIQHLPLVTYNGKAFDIPVLMLWCARNDIYTEAKMLSAFATNKYNHDTHLDLYTWLPNVEYQSLELTAKLLRCQFQPYGDGSMVYGWYENRLVSEIAKHCTADIELTYEICQRTGVCQ